MNGLAMLAQHIIADRIIGDGVFASRRLRLGLPLALVSGLLALLGCGFLIHAMHLWLLSYYTPEMAAALMGVFIIALAAISTAITMGILRMRQNRMNKIHHELKETLQSVFEAFEDELADPVAQNPKTAILLASLAGFAAGEKLH